MPHIPASQALARFRVMDLTQVRAGPLQPGSLRWVKVVRDAGIKPQ